MDLDNADILTHHYYFVSGTYTHCLVYLLMLLGTFFSLNVLKLLNLLKVGTDIFLHKQKVNTKMLYE